MPVGSLAKLVRGPTGFLRQRYLCLAAISEEHAFGTSSKAAPSCLPWAYSVVWVLGHSNFISDHSRVPTAS